MPRGKKYGGKDWVKGQSGNPKGRLKIPEEVKQLRLENRIEVEKLANEYWMLPESELRDIFTHPYTPARNRMIIKVILNGIKSGSITTLGFMADFIFGPKPKQIELNNNTNVKFSDFDKETLKSAFKEIESDV